jgi:hypothetical protein
MFDGMSESMRYIDKLGREERLWFLDDVVEAAEISGLFDNEASLQAIALRIKEIEEVGRFDDASNYSDYLNMERRYYDALEGRGRRKLITLFEKFCESVPQRISERGTIMRWRLLIGSYMTASFAISSLGR